MTHPHLKVETAGPVRTITLDNPARLNAQTPSLWRALADEARSLPEEVRVVVLRGAGPSFSAGIDISLFTPAGLPGEESVIDLARGDADHLVAGIFEFQQGFVTWAEVPAVVIAEVQGHAIGGGFQLALAADLRVVASDAQLAMRETSRGIVPDLGGTKALVDIVGYSRALEICATGRVVTGEEAGRLGIANVVAPAASLGEATHQLVEGILAAPDAALRALKPLLCSAVGADLGEQCRRERETQVDLLRGLLAAMGG
jgi:enoyl-CoA hydratase/carnithine racemase